MLPLLKSWCKGNFFFRFYLFVCLLRPTSVQRCDAALVGCNALLMLVHHSPGSYTFDAKCRALLWQVRGGCSVLCHPFGAARSPCKFPARLSHTLKCGRNRRVMLKCL